MYYELLQKSSKRKKIIITPEGRHLYSGKKQGKNKNPPGLSDDRLEGSDHFSIRI
jgi:hypothetical protein